ncbi:Alpha-expansin 12 [Forsythia ovata]|uniref:Alpha-expansin 12 n=1 Tax=Forsythia ovata TaxID=205694 RepID=A0ABD1Q917_9LAMI
MAFQQNLAAPTMHFSSEVDVSLKQKCNSVSPTATASENVNGCFDCNICLDSAHDPVVTLCGHLYCWPCIYKWLQVQSSSFESDKRPKCPICKANITASSLVPLYGRGTSSAEPDGKKHQLDLVIPHRPSAHGMNTLISAATSATSDPNQQLHPNPFRPQQPAFHHAFGNYASMTPSSFGGTTTTSFFNPTIYMFGEMVFARMFGSSDTSLFSYPHPNSYPITGNGSPRLRRQEMQVDKSLNRFFCDAYLSRPNPCGGMLHALAWPTGGTAVPVLGPSGACGYENTYEAGFGVNTAAVSKVLFKGGQACGGCYQVMCNYRLDPKWCLRRRAVVTVTATNLCPPNNHGGWCDPPNSHFDMSMPAFFRIAKQGNEGIVPVLYRRVPCKRRGGVRFTLKGQSNFNMIMISNVGGSGDILNAWIRASKTRTWIPINRNWGANWQSNMDLRTQTLSFKITLVDGKTLEFFNVVPSSWKFGQTFASRNQFS